MSPLHKLSEEASPEPLRDAVKRQEAPARPSRHPATHPATRGSTARTLGATLHRPTGWSKDTRTRGDRPFPTTSPPGSTKVAPHARGSTRVATRPHLGKLASWRNRPQARNATLHTRGLTADKHRERTGAEIPGQGKPTRDVKLSSLAGSTEPGAQPDVTYTVPRSAGINPGEPMRHRRHPTRTGIHPHLARGNPAPGKTGSPVPTGIDRPEMLVTL